MKLVLLLMVVVYLTHVTCDDPSCFYVCCNPSCSVKCRLCYQGWNGKRQSLHKGGLYYPLHREKNALVNPSNWLFPIADKCVTVDCMRFTIQIKKRKLVSINEVFLFNDLLLITKIFSYKKSGITYSYKQSFPLSSMQVFLFETSLTDYQYGVRLVSGVNNKVLITLNARNDHVRQKFVEDLREAILETNGMETLRIEEELQKHSTKHNTLDRHYANDDSRVLMYELMKPSDPSINRLSAPDCPALQKE